MASGQNPQTKVIELSKLMSPEFGLTPNLGGTLAEAASVCLESQGHSAEAQLHQLGHFSATEVVIHRMDVTQAMINSHRDDDTATWDGAEGIAILLMIELGSGEKFARARKAKNDPMEGGFDYWFTENPAAASVVEDPQSGRLEVAGRRQASAATLRSLLEEKLEQTKQSDEHFSERETLAIVVEFGQPQTWVKYR